MKIAFIDFFIGSNLILQFPLTLPTAPSCPSLFNLEIVYFHGGCNDPFTNDTLGDRRGKVQLLKISTIVLILSRRSRETGRKHFVSFLMDVQCASIGERQLAKDQKVQH